MKSSRIEGKPRQIKDLRERRAGSDLVLYHPQRGRMHVLNASAALIWSLCDGSRTQEDIVERLASEFEIDEDADPAGDVREIIRLFSQENLLDNTGDSRPEPDSAESR